MQNPVAKVSRGGIYKPSVQAEVLQKYQEVWNLLKKSTVRDIAKSSSGGLQVKKIAKSRRDAGVSLQNKLSKKLNNSE